MYNLADSSNDSLSSSPLHQQRQEARPVVLVVDDHQDTRELIKFVLERQGYRIVEAEDGEVAIERGTSEHPDLVLMDLAIPKLDGLSVMKQLRKRTDMHDIPILFISAHAESAVRDQVLAAGCDEYLTKPLDLDNLLRVLDQYISKKKNEPLGDGK
jgi:CheY-like chemotaxis protein